MNRITDGTSVAGGVDPLLTLATASIAEKYAEVRKSAAFKLVKQDFDTGKISQSDFVKEVIRLVQDQP